MSHYPLPIAHNPQTIPWYHANWREKTPASKSDVARGLAASNVAHATAAARRRRSVVQNGLAKCAQHRRTKKRSKQGLQMLLAKLTVFGNLSKTRGTVRPEAGDVRVTLTPRWRRRRRARGRCVARCGRWCMAVVQAQSGEGR